MVGEADGPFGVGKTCWAMSEAKLYSAMRARRNRVLAADHAVLAR